MRATVRPAGNGWHSRRNAFACLLEPLIAAKNLRDLPNGL